MRLLICGRADLGERYLAALVDAGQHGHHGAVDPIVRVLAVLCYPAQRAIYWPDVASEVAPVPGGCLCRLPALGRTARTGKPGRGRLRGTPRPIRLWAASALRAQREALARCRSDAEREIIARHMEGVYRARRSVRVYTSWELAAARRAWSNIRRDGHD